MHSIIDSECPTQIKVLPRVPTYIKIPCKLRQCPCTIHFEYINPISAETMTVFTSLKNMWPHVKNAQHKHRKPLKIVQKTAHIMKLKMFESRLFQEEFVYLGLESIKGITFSMTVYFGVMKEKTDNLTVPDVVDVH